MEPRDYGPFPYTPIKDRPELEWPGGARVAIWVIPNIEFFPLKLGIPPLPGAPPGKPPSVRAWAQRDYGNRVGIWRLMDVLSRHGIRASPTINSDICDHHPQIIRAAVDLGWELLGHNQTNSVWLDQLGPEDERRTISRTLSRIAEMTGRKPVGWLGSGLAETWHPSTFLPKKAVSTSPTGSMTTSPISWTSAASASSRFRIRTRSMTHRIARTATARSTNSKG